MSEQMQILLLPIGMRVTKHVDDLPDDILVEIFSYLSIEELIRYVQHVSCRWQIVAQDTHLRRKLQRYQTFNETGEEILNILRQSPKLRELILNNTDVSSSVLFAVMENCSELRKIEFSESQILSKPTIKSLVLNCRKLEHLTIPSKVVSTLEGSQMIGELKNLKTLNIVDWRDSPCSVFLRPIANGCPSLQHLDIRHLRINTVPFKYFMQLKQNQLQSIKVRWITNRGKCTIPYLTVCKTLNEVVISELPGDDDVYYCDDTAGFKALRSMKTITALTFDKLEYYEVENLISLFSKKGMCQLKELKFEEYPGYDDELSKTICNNCPLLKVLVFRDCFNLSDRSLEDLHKLKELEYLILIPCLGVTDRGMDVLFKCKYLKYLYLSFCAQLTKECMAKLTGLNLLETLILHNCNVEGLPLYLIPTLLPNLRLLSMIYCKGFDFEGLNQLRTEMPHLVVHAIPAPY